ncbi:MSCRAMM family protein [Streptomyces sp. NBC_01255]|uniref:MSCRAMM family protein n=1 Tax=Streptomyces sp. NBC_01255 TaxID=2903798 RepID=UPI002E36C693|nr:prealbumin-like fold domain-containing protein [Streptomyces sp. NBC_01255]
MSLTFRSPRRSISAMVIALAAAITGALAGAPSATAHSTGQTDPAPSAPTARAASEVGTGGVRILKQDPEGALLAGAAFTLADATGKETAHGTTNAEGQLAFVDLAAGIYRLREISSGSPIHDVVADQDVIVTPRADAADDHRPLQARPGCPPCQGR